MAAHDRRQAGRASAVSGDGAPADAGLKRCTGHRLFRRSLLTDSGMLRADCLVRAFLPLSVALRATAQSAEDAQAAVLLKSSQSLKFSVANGTSYSRQQAAIHMSLTGRGRPRRLVWSLRRREPQWRMSAVGRGRGDARRR